MILIVRLYERFTCQKPALLDLRVLTIFNTSLCCAMTSGTHGVASYRAASIVRVFDKCFRRLSSPDDIRRCSHACSPRIRQNVAGSRATIPSAASSASTSVPDLQRPKPEPCRQKDSQGRTKKEAKRRAPSSRSKPVKTRKTTSTNFDGRQHSGTFAQSLFTRV